jgi:pimeloyl-ACP methyl ester carboxylesterase
VLFTEIQSLPGTIIQPSLFIGANRDPIGIPAVQLSITLPYAQAIQIRTVDAGHYVQSEQAQEVNTYLHNFFLSLP